MVICVGYSQPEKKNPFEFLSPQQETDKQGPKFGRATAMKKLMQFYEQTPNRNSGIYYMVNDGF